MTEFIPPIISLDEAVKQIEHWCHTKDKKGKRTDEYDSKKVKEYLEALYDQMEIDNWLALAEAYKGVALGDKFESAKRRGRPPGPYYGLSGAERNAKEREKAKALGVWHTKYPDGCTECKKKDYAHVSGGICNRCRQGIRAAGISIKEYRRMKRDLVSNGN